MRLICFTLVFAASMRALLTPVAYSTSDQVGLVLQNKTDSIDALKYVTGSSKGKLKATVKATTDGYFRFVFAGASTTAAGASAGDFVDVR